MARISEYRANNYCNGHIERKSSGRFEGTLVVEGIDLSPIYGVYFKEDDKTYLWLRRKPLLEYNHKTESYKERQREPYWETYLQKQVNDNGVSFRGEFILFKFKFVIVGIWDSVLGLDKNRLNLFVDRLPQKEQSIINGINQRKLLHDE